ncbi:MAG: phosphatidate cytidylyltransferase [Hyphomicrobiales bacterium]|nr:phosphatidate cytidylyltransferase [Hyphomicrobiales bacterium]
MNATPGGRQHSGETPGGKKPNELMLRVNSALILVTLTLLLAYAGPVSFAVLIAVFGALMAWEWGRLVRGRGLDEAFAVQVGGCGAAALLAAYQMVGVALLIIIITTAAVFALRRTTDDAEKAWWSAAGVYYIGLPAIALIWLRGDPTDGWGAILFLFVVVWTTDSAAFVFGRLIGGPKLAPRISPKKTWAGLFGALLAAGVAGALFAIPIGGSSLALAGVAVLLSLAAQLGDLAESAMKRLFGFKDTSGLIPGHGGVLDRMDGLVAASVAAAALAWAVDPGHPGAALLMRL